MKKSLKLSAAILLLSGFLVACAGEGDEENPEDPLSPDVPNEQMPEDGTDTDDSGL